MLRLSGCPWNSQDPSDLLSELRETRVPTRQPRDEGGNGRKSMAEGGFRDLGFRVFRVAEVTSVALGVVYHNFRSSS